MKKLIIISIFYLAFSSSASATVINVTLDFQSGAQFVGTITFSDTHTGMIDTDGYLNGGTNNFVNEYFHWTWWEGTNQANPNDSNSDGYWNDWLMNNTEGGNDYTMYIGLSWTGRVINSGGISFITVNDPYYNGNTVYSDLITSINQSGVPGPSSLILMLLGLLRFALVTRPGLYRLKAYLNSLS